MKMRNELFQPAMKVKSNGGENKGDRNEADSCPYNNHIDLARCEYCYFLNYCLSLYE